MNKISGSKRPTARQQRWHDWLREQGCYLGLGPAAIHHCVGSTARHNKLHIGQDFVIPLSWEAHQGPRGIHGDMSIFHGHGLGDTRKQIEKTIFRRMIETYKRQHHGEIPMDADVYVAIMGYRR